MNKSLFSGGPIELSKGWALMVSTDKAHYWKFAFTPLPGFNHYKSLCGLNRVSGPHTPPLDPGNWPKCKNCLRIKVMGELNK